MPVTHPAFDAERVLQALLCDDLDAAINAGLIHAPDATALRASGLSDADAQLIDTAATQRRRAWAARARFEARNARVVARKQAREAAHRNKLDATTRLPPAANAALLRALARVRKPKV